MLYRKGSLNASEKRMLDVIKSLILSGKYTLNNNNNKSSCIMFIACQRLLGEDILTTDSIAAAAKITPTPIII